MTQSDVPEIRPGLSQLSWKSWLMVALSLSAIGSQLTVWGLRGIYHLYVGSPDNVTIIIVPHFFGSPRLLELGYVFLLALTVNFCGALAVIGILAIRRRLKA